MELAIYIVSLIAFGYYISLFYNGSKYLKNNESSSAIPSDDSTKVTVVVPFRDATEELLIWLTAFDKVLYAHQTEVLLINDGSVNSLRKLRNRIKQYPNVTLIDRSHKGKKKAIEYGVSIAKGEIIVCTDADTVPRPGWIAGILACMRSADVQMACGRVAPGEGHWYAAIDFMALMAAGEVLIKKKRPVMCSGSHMAFRKAAFESVEGYTGHHHYRSGDDVVLLHKIKSRYGAGAIAYNDVENAHVITRMPSDFGKVLVQRQRWGGKAVYYRDQFSLLLAVLVLYCAIMTYGIFTVAWPHPYRLGLAAILVGLKAFVDIRLIRTYAFCCYVPVNNFHLLAAIFIYPIAIGLTFLRILVRPNPRW